ncbi:MAG TPA: hypothetical protein PLS30_15035, partial [Flavobacteriales bacterium]|nr:hypothetical protein [Flavobacteriales bacterium]
LPASPRCVVRDELLAQNVLKEEAPGLRRGFSVIPLGLPASLRCVVRDELLAQNVGNEEGLTSVRPSQ